MQNPGFAVIRHEGEGAGVFASKKSLFEDCIPGRQWAEKKFQHYEKALKPRYW